MSENTKDTLKVIALKQRIGEITSDYEDRMADLRANTTLMVQNYERNIEDLKQELAAERTKHVAQEQEAIVPAAILPAL